MTNYKIARVTANIDDQNVNIGDIKSVFYSKDKNTASIIIRITKNGIPFDLTSTTMKPILNLFCADGSIFTKVPVEVTDGFNGEITYNISEEVIIHVGRVRAKLFLETEDGTESVHVSNFDFEIRDSGIDKIIEKIVDIAILDDKIISVIEANPDRFKGEAFTFEDFTSEQLELLKVKGDEGYSAYEVWLQQGNTGTVNDYLNAIKGVKGDTGKSAYESAVANGFVGTEQEWIASLKGKDAVITDGSIKPEKTTFFEKTRNLFDGVYHKYYLGGTTGTSGYLFKGDDKRRTAIIPVVQGKTYYVKVHDPSLSNNYRIGLNEVIPTVYEPSTNGAKITNFLIYNDIQKEGAFTSTLTGYAFINVSNNASEPRLQVEEGTAATTYIPSRIISKEFIPEPDMTLAKAADTKASSALTLANTADTKASSALTLANTADTKAERAINNFDSIFDPSINLFNGTYHPYYIGGAQGSTGYLFNNDPSRRTAIVKVSKDKTYYVKVHDPSLSDAYRIAVHTSIPTTFDPSTGGAALTKFLIYNDIQKEGAFTSPIDGYAFINVSSGNKEPRLQVEEGTAPTAYTTARTISQSVLPKSNASSLDSIMVDSERNLFDGNFYPWIVGGTLGQTAVLMNTNPDANTVVFPIKTNEYYTIKIHEPLKADRFTLGIGTAMPNFSTGNTQSIKELLVFNGSLKQYTFQATIDGLAFLYVSSTNQKPKVQVEKGKMATTFVGYKSIRTDLIAQGVTELIDTEPMPMFPQAVNMTMTPTESPGIAGPRFIDYFDDKMWGYTAGLGAISYSVDNGKTWTEHNRTWKHTEYGWMSRLMPTSDGEVLAMTATDLRKSIGWGTPNITWSENKVAKHANGTLFQFSFDGDGKKFILCEYGASVPNWVDSRFVWISTDSGNTFNVVWDSLVQHGETINSETHLHGVAYDRWGDRFYFAEGHGRRGGIYVSTDDGATWLQPEGYRDGVLASLGIAGHQYPEEDTNGCTVIVATPAGLVMGSDNANNGMFGVPRKENVMEEVVQRTYAAKDYHAGLNMFAIRGWYDELSGSVLISFRSEFDDVPPIICAGTPTKATMIYEYPNLPVRGGQDLFGCIAKTSPDKLVVYAQIQGLPYTAVADLAYPASEIKNMIYQELKRYKLV